MPEGFHQLGWLWTECAQLPGESHNYEHARAAFIEAADRAAAQQDWLLLFESRLGAATVHTYEAMHPDFEPDKVEEHLRQARRQHMKVATRISRLLSQPEVVSTVSDQLRLQKVVQAFTAILLINSDPKTNSWQFSIASTTNPSFSTGWK